MMPKFPSHLKVTNIAKTLEESSIYVGSYIGMPNTGMFLAIKKMDSLEYYRNLSTLLTHLFIQKRGLSVSTWKMVTGLE